MRKTPYELHVERWSKGCEASICPGARNVCIGRGSLPALVVFVGLAPGEGEDSLGEPFVGPAGHLLDDVIRDSVPPHVPYAISNLTGCIPRDDMCREREPLPEEIEQCAPRLQEFIDLASPKLLIAVGKVAGDYLRPGYRHGVNHRRLPVVEIRHPAYILRQPFGHRAMMVTRCVIQVRDAIDAYVTRSQT